MGMPSLRAVDTQHKHITERLRDLRTRAGLSRDAVAEALGYANGSSYQRYETPERYRKDFLPLELVRRLAPLFAEHGVPLHETLALAGLPAGPDSDAAVSFERIPLARVGIVVQALAELLAEDRLVMPPADQAETVVTFLRWYEEEAAAGRRDEPVLDTATAKSLLRLIRRVARR
ncbi:helix-turn-helix domain-containing protein [Azospirillum brasilense]|uniref:helix-turn-helix domain-containing protein n=1 Tax=Azospirillum argentinense TaxID=2970906 RepID=UPI00190EB014|nr:helix-turn-helix domain-containing protein [Azospirillum argentinense]MBK3804165.1 helix-turn-helix domain-containing protein [Azospirillum argentinense]